MEVSWEIIRQKISRWETYLEENKGCSCLFLKNSVINKINRYIYAYLFGLENGPKVVDDTGTVDRNAIQSYEKFIQKNKNSIYYNIVKKYFDILKKKKFNNITNKDILSCKVELRNFNNHYDPNVN